MIFPCPLCGQKLRAADDAGGKRCRCTKCKSLVPIPLTPVQRPHPMQPVAPRPVAPPRNVLAEELEELIVERHQQSRQRAVEQAEERAQATRQQRVLRAKAKAATRSAAKPGGLPVFVTVVLASCGVLCLFCGGAVGLLYWKNLPPAMVLKAGGYQATAYGKTTNSRNDGTTDAKGTLSPTTGSEFWIAAVQLPSDTHTSVEELKTRFASSAETVEVVQRGELQGIKCTKISSAEMGAFQNLQPEMEIFMIPNQLIFLTYVPGSNKFAAGLQSRALPVHRERSHDNPERFFESLRPVSSTPDGMEGL